MAGASDLVNVWEIRYVDNGVWEHPAVPAVLQLAEVGKHPVYRVRAVDSTPPYHNPPFVLFSTVFHVRSLDEVITVYIL